MPSFCPFNVHFMHSLSSWSTDSLWAVWHWRGAPSPCTRSNQILEGTLWHKHRLVHPQTHKLQEKNPWWKKKWESVWSSETSKWKPCSPPTNVCVRKWIGEGGCDWGTHQQSPPSLVTIHPGGLLALSITQQRHTVSSRSPDLTPAEEPAAAADLEKSGSIPSRLEQSTMAGSTVLHSGFLLTLAGILLFACSSAQRVRGKQCFLLCTCLSF